MKKLLCVLFAVLVVIGFSTTLVFALISSLDNDDEALQSTSGPSAPRPEDPGTIPPVGEDASNIANGIVWDMESLPEDLVEAEWLFPVYGDFPEFVEGNVTYKRADGRGRNGTAALQITQVGQYSWSDVFMLSTDWETSGTWYWKDSDVMWIWYDNTELDTDVHLEIFVNENSMAIGSLCYEIREGTDGAVMGAIPPGWPGAEYGRIYLRANTKGWIGVPLDAYHSTIGFVRNLRFHIAYKDIEHSGKHLYLDDLCVLPRGEYPTDLK